MKYIVFGFLLAVWCLIDVALRLTADWSILLHVLLFGTLGAVFMLVGIVVEERGKA